MLRIRQPRNSLISWPCSWVRLCLCVCVPFGRVSAGTPTKKGGPQQLLDDALQALESGDSSLLLERSAVKGGKKNKKAQQGELPIHHAARTKAVESMRKMLAPEHGGSSLQEEQLLAQGAGGRLPLHYAVQTRHVDTVNELVGAGSVAIDGGLTLQQVGTADGGGMLPVHYAMKSGDHATMHALVASGSEEQLTTPDPGSGETAIHHAARAGASDLVEAMIAPLGPPESAGRHAVLHAADKEGRLPVHCAVLAGDRTSALVLGGVAVPSGSGGSQQQQAGQEEERAQEGGGGGGDEIGDGQAGGGGGDAAGGQSPMLAADRHGKLALDYALDMAAQAKENAELTLTRSDADWTSELEAVVVSHTESMAAMTAESEEKDAQLAAQQETIDELQTEVASLKQQIEQLRTAGTRPVEPELALEPEDAVAGGVAAGAGAGDAVAASAEEGVPPE